MGLYIKLNVEKNTILYIFVFFYRSQQTKATTIFLKYVNFYIFTFYGIIHLLLLDSPKGCSKKLLPPCLYLHPFVEFRTIGYKRVVAFVTSKLLFSTERQHTKQDLTLFNKDSAKAITQDIQVFNCELGSIRVIVDNGEPLFCLSDLCDVLEIQNKTRVKEYIDKEFDYDLPTRHPILDTLGREQQAFFIKEHHLYYVLNNSKSEKAKPFRKMVNVEILPSIRKNGGYIAGQESMSELEILANALVA